MFSTSFPLPSSALSRLGPAVVLSFLITPIASASPISAIPGALPIQVNYPVGHNASLYLTNVPPQSELEQSLGTKSELQQPWAPGTLRVAQIGPELGGHTLPVRSIAFSPDGSHWASGSADKTIKIWNLSAPLVQDLRGQTDQITSVAFSPDGQWLASAALDGSVFLWDWRTGEIVQEFSQYMDDERRQEIANLAFSPDGQILATSSGRSSIKLWDMAAFNATGQMTLRDELETTQSVESLAFSPDSTLLASAGLGRMVELWDVTESKLQNTLGPFDRAIYAVQFSPEGDRLAFSPDALTAAQAVQFENTEPFNTLRLWNLDGRQVGPSLIGHEDYVSSIDFSPDGQFLLSGSWDQSVAVWDTTSGTQVNRLMENTERVLAVDFSPTNDVFVLGSGDGTIQVFVLRDEFIAEP